MVDHDGVWMLQQPSQLHGNLGETESATTEDLERVPKVLLRTQKEVDHPRVAEECGPELAQGGSSAAGKTGCETRGDGIH